ncbi:MAG TPA: aldo/keto reductase [Methylomirabilota bacterium]|nr:aldo/keto reductase [Methylomirabilota bacterium]
MERRTLGRTGLEVNPLGFGCGAVGGLMTRGEARDQERAVARALELGINYFDTAPIYGDGESERNLGRVWKALKPAAYVGTKVRLSPDERGRIAAAVPAALEASLKRLQMERVDLLQLHNVIDPAHPRGVDARKVLEEVVPALDKLKQAGKARFYGITALGETASLSRVLEARALDTAQVCLNLLNPSAAGPVPRGFPAQDFDGLLPRARANGVGAIIIRVLAGGALSGTESRHAVAAPEVEPIASGPDYVADVRRGRTLDALAREGHAGSVVEAALRFPLSSPAVSTVLVGYSTLDHLEYAAACMAKGPLPPAALQRLAEIWKGWAGSA